MTASPAMAARGGGGGGAGGRASVASGAVVLPNIPSDKAVGTTGGSKATKKKVGIALRDSDDEESDSGSEGSYEEDSADEGAGDGTRTAPSSRAGKDSGQLLRHRMKMGTHAFLAVPCTTGTIRHGDMRL